MFNDRLIIGLSVILFNECVKNCLVVGYYLNLFIGLYFFLRDRDFFFFRDNYFVNDLNRNVIGQNWFVIDYYQFNLYWLINEQFSVYDIKCMIGSLNLDYKFSEKLSIIVRVNYDFVDKLIEQQFISGGNIINIYFNGSWDYFKFLDELIYMDVLLKYNENFGDFSVGVIGGSSYQKIIFGLGICVDGNVNNGLLYLNEFYF